jgi:hypothetical protein
MHPGINHSWTRTAWQSGLDWIKKQFFPIYPGASPR